MSSNQEYNGWPNYETWYVNLMIVGDLTAEDVGIDVDEYDTDTEKGQRNLVYDVSQALKAYVEELMNDVYELEDLPKAMVNAFISDVRWYRIATHTVEDYIDWSNFPQR